MLSAIFDFLPKLLNRLFFRKLNLEHAKEGLAALRLAESIFHTSNSLGGMYSYPWYVGRELIDGPKLQEELSNLGNRSRSKKLKKLLDAINESLKTLFVNAVYGPSIAFEDSPMVSPEQFEIDVARAERQQKANDEGILLVVKARELVTKLETRLDLG
jgi:hypothetical protein